MTTTATVLGLPMHAEMQRQMNFHLYEILHTLGYRIDIYGSGGAHIVTGCRLPLPGGDSA